MRELKFRVWCKRTQEYHIPIDEEDYDADGENLWLQMCIDTNGRLYFIETSNEDADYEYVTHDCEIIDGEDAKDFIIELDTGFKDKNGKKICEGDIVNYEDYENYAVEQSKSGAWTIGKTELFGLSPYCEVIGNIHENPELLERQK